jgi:hypothetical protein
VDLNEDSPELGDDVKETEPRARTTGLILWTRVVSVYALK